MLYNTYHCIHLSSILQKAVFLSLPEKLRASPSGIPSSKGARPIAGPCLGKQAPNKFSPSEGAVHPRINNGQVRLVPEKTACIKVIGSVENVEDMKTPKTWQKSCDRYCKRNSI